MCAPIGKLILGAIVARRATDRYPLQGRRLERLVHSLNRLGRPDILALSEAPANREDRGLMLGIMNGRADGVHPPLLGKGREVDDDLRTWGKRCGDLNVEQDLAIGIGILAR